MEEKTFISNIKDTFTDLTSSFSNLIFIKSKFVGLLLFACTLFNFNIAAQGIISLVVSILFARFIGIKKDDPKEPSGDPFFDGPRDRGCGDQINQPPTPSHQEERSYVFLV